MLKKLFHLPSPKELGWSQSNALPLRSISLRLKPDELTWEDWRHYVKNMYPIKYFFTETLSTWINRKYCKLQNIIWWCRYKFHPKYKYHILNLSQPSPGINYKYGYLDPTEKILYANFIILRDFFEQEYYPYFCKFGQWYYDGKIHQEILFLKNWWERDRELEINQVNFLFKKYKDSLNEEDYQTWLKYHKWLEFRDDQMLRRLIKIRKHLWI